MEFTSSEEIDAPIEAVFAEITDFAAFERLARRRGAELTRTDTRPAPGVGMGWHASFTFGERRREVDLALVDHDPPHGITLDIASPAITGRVRVDLVALSPARTRLRVDLTVEAKGMAGRVMLQPVKLMRGNLTHRFRLRVADYAADLEERFRNRA
jgi:carbon monoxide dehydrogenase subunit G